MCSRLGSESKQCRETVGNVNGEIRVNLVLQVFALEECALIGIAAAITATKSSEIAWEGGTTVQQPRWKSRNSPGATGAEREPRALVVPSAILERLTVSPLIGKIHPLAAQESRRCAYFG